MPYVFDFREADGSDKELLGGKGAGLAEMTHLGVPVPPGFIITTAACRAFLEGDGDLPPGLWDEILEAIERLEELTSRSFGGADGLPLLVSVRSGAKYSMPGMMDTILNLGITAEVVDGLAQWGTGEFAADADRRFVQTFGKVVLRVAGDSFEAVLTELRSRRGVKDDSQLTATELDEAAQRFRDIVRDHSAREIPADPYEQLEAAVRAVFHSWNNPRAHTYRELHGIPGDLGTACNIQMMVFGDLGPESGTGVCFTRDPATGAKSPYGDYLPNAQGEDVVAGIRNTLSLAKFAELHPDRWEELRDVMEILEKHYRDMCDLEFTIEGNRLWMLQTRVGKRTVHASVRIATSMVSEGLIDEREAVLRVDPGSLDQLLHPRLPDVVPFEPIATGVAASPGAASGEAVFDADTAVAKVAGGTEVILIRRETNPDDIHGLAACSGVLTSHGGKTSHAAVVARGMGKPAVTGAAELEIEESEGFLAVNGVRVSAGDNVTIDGTTGRVFVGTIELVAAESTPELDQLLEWADRFRRLGVRANADTPSDAEWARDSGAEGIGLARTEHMFLGERLPIVQQIILGRDQHERKAALEKLRDLQVEDFTAILEVMDGLPVIVRLLDPPLHEFLPDRWALELQRDEAVAAGQPSEEIAELMAEVARWEEDNPMLGLRGVRLGILMPELYLMQVRAALTAVERRLEAGGDPHLEIMIPFVTTGEELRRSREMIERELAEITSESDLDLPVLVGTMIEIPRAALTAGDIAEWADFLSFGTNDLTQMTYGFSRDDAEGSFLGAYIDDGILTDNPFASFDPTGVGRLVELATREGKEAKAGLEVGVCGEHGGDPGSIVFFDEAGLDYVSCSPPRLPVARLAAAHASLGGEASTSTV
ncbi:MAG: pyruvate, phosphate dikinase [Acidimicrobiia bacterium]